LYGAERVILGLLENTDRNRFDLSLAAFDDAREPHRELLDRAEGIRVGTYPIHCSKRIDFSALKQLMSVLRTQAIDILHCHEQKSDLYGFLAARLCGIPVVATGHSWNRANLTLTFYESIDALLLRFFNRVVPVSRKLKGMMRRFGIPADKLQVVPNGVDLTKFGKRSADAERLRKELGILPAERVVGNVGRLVEVKGQKYLMEAAKGIIRRYPEVKFLIVGDGPLKSRLLRQVATLGIENHIIFAGFRDDMPDLYSVMDVFALSSNDEASPMTIFEAAAAGLPIVATKVGGIVDVITDRQNGLLVEPHDSKTLSQAILYLLENEAESDRLGKTAALTVLRQHSIEVMVRSYETIYEDVLGRCGS
jgi:glycosyltransferase involved in cell wall biosynthesis